LSWGIEYKITESNIDRKKELSPPLTPSYKGGGQEQNIKKSS